jgi:hypothetical protein
MHPALTAVTSSNLAGYGYVPASSQLVIQFKSGKLYRYDGVPNDVVKAFESAGSKGKFFGANIRNQFETTEISDDDATALFLFRTKSSQKAGRSQALRKQLRRILANHRFLAGAMF